MYNSEKTVSANSRGIIVSYTDANKHMFMNYETPKHIRKIQLEDKPRYQKIENVFFNKTQKDVYLKTVYGFEAFTKEEIAKMSKRQKFNITVIYTKANRILNRWKQEIVNEGLDSLLKHIFPNSPLVSKITSIKGYDDRVICDISFKDLGISRKQIADKLIEFGILPQNFYQLT